MVWMLVWMLGKLLGTYLLKFLLRLLLLSRPTVLMGHECGTQVARRVIIYRRRMEMLWIEEMCRFLNRWIVIPMEMLLSTVLMMVMLSLSRRHPQVVGETWISVWSKWSLLLCQNGHRTAETCFRESRTATGLQRQFRMEP